MTRASRPPPWLRRSDVFAALAKKELEERGELSPKKQGKSEQQRYAERYRHDLVGFCKRVLGMEPWRYTPLPDCPPEMKKVLGDAGQLEVLEAIQDSVNRQLAGEEDVPYIFLVEAPHGVGKCVAKDDEITLADGEKVAASELVGKHFKLLTLLDGKPTEVEAFAYWNAVETVYEITTETGKRLTRNAEHPLWAATAHFAAGTHPKITATGFRPTGELKVGDVIAAAEELPAFGHSALSPEAIKLLAYLIGDGGYTQDGVIFLQQEGAVLEEFKACAKALGCVWTRRNAYDYRFTGFTGKKGGNPLINLLRQHDLMGKHSREKRIPRAVYQFSSSQLALFLSRLFSTDGWAAVSRSDAGKNGKRQPQREVGFCSASQGLVEDVAYLLQKLGIHARTWKKPKTNAWVLSIKEAAEQVKFADRVGIFGKEEALDGVVALARPLAEHRAAAAARRKDQRPWNLTNAHLGTRWERIVAIQEHFHEQTVAISVPVHHTFLTQFYEHNTYGIEAPVAAWFYRCFTPSVTQTTANSITQVRDNLWKNIRQHGDAARAKGRNILPGLYPKGMRAELSADHFAMGFVTSDAGNTGTERAQGQHNEFHLWIFDEAEGIEEFMFSAVKRQLTGNTVRLWLMIANPKTATSEFQEMKLNPLAKVFHMSLLSFPNVVKGTGEVPNGTSRSTFNEWIEDQRTFGCEVVEAHDETKYTFEVPWPVKKSGGGEHLPGTIFAPKRGMLYSALGIPPSGGGGDTFISAGRIDACLGRDVTPRPQYRPYVQGEDNPEWNRDPLLTLHADPATGKARVPIWSVQLGVDCARYGDDAGTIYSLFKRVLRFEAAIQGALELDEITRTDRYVRACEKVLRRAAAAGATKASIRIDGSGGYGSGIVDGLRKLEELEDLFPDGYEVHEVLFNTVERIDASKYADLVTEMYAAADDVLSHVRIDRPSLPPLLKRDLTERKFKYVTKGDQDVAKLEKKSDFKNRNKGQSPDDGDGAVLALAPERLFAAKTAKPRRPRKRGWATWTG